MIKTFTLLGRCIVALLVLESCQFSDDSNRAMGFEKSSIPVKSLKGRELGYAHLNFYDETLEHRGRTFRKFSLEFDNDHVIESLDMVAKYGYWSKDEILIASKIKNRKSQEQISVDTLINLKSLLPGSVYDFESAFYGFSWGSERYPDGVDQKTGKPIYHLRVVERGYPYPGSVALFTFNSDLLITGIKVEEIDPTARYR